MNQLISEEELQTLYDKINQLEIEMMGKASEIVMLNDRIGETQEAMSAKKVDEILEKSLNVGESDDKLTRTANEPEQLTERQQIFSEGRRTIRSLGVRRKTKIACRITVRDKKADEIIESDPST
eukprot:7573481-Heterocapsa_arctica.AAC.1